MSCSNHKSEALVSLALRRRCASTIATVACPAAALRNVPAGTAATPLRSFTKRPWTSISVASRWSSRPRSKCGSRCRAPTNAARPSRSSPPWPRPALSATSSKRYGRAEANDDARMIEFSPRALSRIRGARSGLCDESRAPCPLTQPPGLKFPRSKRLRYGRAKCAYQFHSHVWPSSTEKAALQTGASVFRLSQ